MKKGFVVIGLFIVFSGVVTGQNKFKSKIDSAYSNSLKGIYFALENIPDRKNSYSKDLIAQNKLIAQIKISKGIGGVYVQSTGFCDSYKTTSEIYRDYKSLKTEGYIDYIPHRE
jgi:hypothetical protein